MVNRVALSGRLLARGALRYTPSGIQVVEFRLEHESKQQEAGLERRVSCEVACVVLGAVAGLLATAKLGDVLTVMGFLTAKTVKTPTLVLHVNEIEFLEGHENGI